MDLNGSVPAFGGNYPQVGDVLGRYELLAILGAGGMGCVFRARDTHTGGEVALKVLPRELWLRPENRERFRREVGILAGLRYISGAAPIFDHGEQGDWLFYTMALVEGENLEEHAAELPLARRLGLVAAVARTVARLHAAGICHRDLKPDNILVCQGEPVLIDFGIAKLLEPHADHTLTQRGCMLGTPRYLPPEMPSELQEDPAVAKAADVYVLGVIAYELLAGRLPYDIDELWPTEAHEVVREGAADLRKRAPRVPEAVAAAVMPALARDWRERPAAGAFADRLQSAAAAVAAGGAAPASHWRRRGPWLAAAGGLALLLLAGALALRHYPPLETGANPDPPAAPTRFASHQNALPKDPPAVSGARLVFADGESIFTRTADGSRQALLGGIKRWGEISLAANRLAFIGEVDGEAGIFVLDLGDRELQRVAYPHPLDFEDGPINDLALNPTGAALAICGSEAGDHYHNHGIYVIDLGDGAIRRLVRDRGRHYTDVQWQAPGMIVHTRTPVGNAYGQRVWSIDPESGESRQLGDSFSSGAAAAADGQWLALIAEPQPPYLCTMDLPDRRRQILLTLERPMRHPRILGEHIYFGSGGQLCRVRRDGTGLEQLAELPGKTQFAIAPLPSAAVSEAPAQP